MPGKAGTNFSAFVALIDVLREQTEGLSPAQHHRADAGQRPDLAHYRTDREGQDRIENLKNLSTPPKASSRRKALAAMPWPCAGQHGQPAKPGQPGAGPECRRC